jgi:1,5-anhydro-D-fructose reductase (1,5-anhydro-D-mannitol-forming)
MDQVRWGIIGCGDVTEVKSGPAFQKVAKSRLVAVMRRNGALAADYARRHGVARWYDRAEALVHDDEVDAIYVATPPGSHLDYALMASAAGKPAYVEKPMARTFSECRRMVDAFEKAKVPLFVAYYRRALDRFRAVRDLVASGRLGTITAVRYLYAKPPSPPGASGALPWRLRAEESGGGLFLDLGSHTLDILDFILGPLENVRGEATNMGSPYDVEDTVAVHFSTPSGAIGTAHWNFANTEQADEIVISGDDGEVRLATFGDGPIDVRTGPRVERLEFPNPTNIQAPMIESVVADLLGTGRCESPGATAARTSAVIDATLKGYYGSRDGEFWKNPARWPGRAKRGDR